MPELIDNIETTVRNYVEAWNTTDQAQQVKLIEACWALEGVLTDNHSHVEGRDALIKMIDDFKVAKPGFTFVTTSIIDQHHNVCRASYKMLNASGQAVLKAMDIVEFDEAGQIKRLITFFGPLPNRKR